MIKNKSIINSLIISIILCAVYAIICFIFKAAYHIEFIILILLINYSYIKLSTKINPPYRQLEILIPLIADLDIKQTLPNTRGFAASPDYLCSIKNIIKEKKPNLILEAGSGISTIISAYTLKKYGGGKIISLDHEKEYAQQTVEELKKHGLEEYANVIYAPLKKYGDLIWYDYNLVNEDFSIDLFTIDGPPEKKGQINRYPAIPLMFDKLNENAIIMLDDARRKNEQLAIKLWLEEYSCFNYEYIDNDKGLAILRKKNA